MLVILNLIMPADLIFWRGRVSHWVNMNAATAYEAASGTVAGLFPSNRN
jgi:hypothetical protein